MMNSFRLRLALLSVLLTGLVLVAFGFGSWWLIRSIKIERIDSELRRYAEREVTRSHTELEWRREEELMAVGLGVRDGRNLIVLVEDAQGETVYRSLQWPAGLDSRGLPWPSEAADVNQPKSSWLNTPMTIPFVSGAQAAGLPNADGVLLAQAGRSGGPRSGAGPGPAPSAKSNPAWRPFPDDLGRGVRPGSPPSAAPPSDATRSQQSPAELIAPPASWQPNAVSVQTPPMQIAPLTPSLPSLIPSAPAPLPQGADTSMSPPFLPPRLSSSAPPILHLIVVERLVDGQVWRMALARTDLHAMAIGMSVAAIAADMNGIRNAFLVALPFALTLLGISSWFFASRALRPVKKLTLATQSITAEGLDRRLATQGEDHEFSELIEVFNRMLARLERSFQQAHRFTADAAHELKTPLAIVQGQLERTISQAEEGSVMQAALTSTLDEVRRLSVISRKLLLLSQADAGRLMVFRETVDLSRILEELSEDTRMLAPHLVITSDIKPGLMLQADGSLLRQVLHNLISNAIKYNLEGGWIRISSTRWAQRIEVVISNASTGIAVGDRDRIFERFFRVDSAHSRNVEGLGLGLSVSREIARAHGGDLLLKGDVVGEVRFCLLLSA